MHLHKWTWNPASATAPKCLETHLFKVKRRTATQLNVQGCQYCSLHCASHKRRQRCIIKKRLCRSVLKVFSYNGPVTRTDVFLGTARQNKIRSLRVSPSRFGPREFPPLGSLRKRARSVMCSQTPLAHIGEPLGIPLGRLRMLTVNSLDCLSSRTLCRHSKLAN